jgi:hypothetical protein
MQSVPKWRQSFRPHELEDAVTTLSSTAGAKFDDAFKFVLTKEKPEDFAIINKETNEDLAKALSFHMNKIKFVQGEMFAFFKVRHGFIGSPLLQQDDALWIKILPLINPSITECRLSLLFIPISSHFDRL